MTAPVTAPVTATTDPGLLLFVRKLERFGPLADEERRALQTLPLPARRVGADRELVRRGERPSHCLLLLDGMACRHKALEDGRRQIVAFHVPGDLLDPAGLLPGPVDHSVAALTPARVAPVPRAALLDRAERHPNLGRALWRDALADAAISREWVVNVGRRTAYARVAHLLCELVARLRAAGLARGRACDLPIGRFELADATGLSAVHVDRVLQRLRGAGLIEWRNGTLVTPDWAGLTRAAGFDPAYLHPPAASA